MSLAINLNQERMPFRLEKSATSYFEHVKYSLVYFAY